MIGNPGRSVLYYHIGNRVSQRPYIIRGFIMVVYLDHYGKQYHCFLYSFPEKCLYQIGRFGSWDFD